MKIQIIHFYSHYFQKQTLTQVDLIIHHYHYFHANEEILHLTFQTLIQIYKDCIIYQPLKLNLQQQLQKILFILIKAILFIIKDKLHLYQELNQANILEMDQTLDSTISTFKLFPKVSTIAICQQFSFLDKQLTPSTKENYNILQEPLESKFSGYQIVIAFEFGIIISYDFFNQVGASLYNYDFDKREPIINKTVIQLIAMPERDGELTTFLALYEDSTIIQYYFNIEVYDSEFLGEIDYYVKKFKIFDAKKYKSLQKQTNGIKIICYANPNLPGFTINSGQCNFISLQKCSEQTVLNPKAFCKFNAIRITEATIVSHPFFLKFLPNCQDNQQDPLILVFVGSDGVLRFFDYEEKQMVFAYESSLSGQVKQFFVYQQISGDYRYIALACQDDTAVLLDLTKFTYLQFYNHKSFITRILFYSPKQYITTSPSLKGDEILRLIVASLDATISLIEIKPDEKYEELQKSCESFRSQLMVKKLQQINDTTIFPIICSQNIIDGQQILIPPEKVFFKTQRDLSIGNIKIIDNHYLLITCYDGSLIMLTIEVQEVQVINPNSYGFQYSFTEKNSLDQKFQDIKRQYKKYQAMKDKVMGNTIQPLVEEEKQQE